MFNSTKPYFDENKKPILEQSVIVVADILGFKDRIQNAFATNSQQTLLEDFHKSLNDALSYINDPSGSKWSAKIFSDNLIIGYRFLGQGGGAFEFPQACHSIGHFQRELAKDGIFLRGGIAVDFIHISDSLIFGNVLQDLSCAEKEARYPRVVLLKSAKTFLNNNLRIKNDPLLGKIISPDSDKLFINYLYPLDARNDSSRISMILKHKRCIESNLARFQSQFECSRIYEKYVWLAKYHNTFCRTSHNFQDSKFLIDNSKFASIE